MKGLPSPAQALPRVKDTVKFQGSTPARGASAKPYYMQASAGKGEGEGNFLKTNSENSLILVNFR